MFQQDGDLVVIDRNTALLADLCDQRAIAGVNAQWHLHLDVAHCLRRRQGRRQVDVAAQIRIHTHKCDQHHTAGGSDHNPKRIPFHKINSLHLALPTGAMHSSRRFKGKLTERWGRKASGLRDVCAYHSGVAVRTLTHSVRSPKRTGREVRPNPRIAHKSPKPVEPVSPRYLDKAKLQSLNPVPSALRHRDALGSSSAWETPCGGTAQIRERSHVLFNIVLLYSVSRIEMGRSFSGVTS